MFLKQVNFKQAEYLFMCVRTLGRYFVLCDLILQCKIVLLSCFLLGVFLQSKNTVYREIFATVLLQMIFLLMQLHMGEFKTGRN